MVHSPYMVAALAAARHNDRLAEAARNRHAQVAREYRRERRQDAPPSRHRTAVARWLSRRGDRHPQAVQPGGAIILQAKRADAAE